MAAVVSEGLGCLIHQILFVSSIYPSVLFELAPFGSFRYRRSRHPDLIKYAEQVAESIQVLLTAGSKTVETVTVAVLDESELVAEWVIDLTVDYLKNIDSEIFKSWIGSIAVKMQQMIGRIPTATEPSSRTFTVNVGLKQSLSSYRLGADLDWIMADSKSDVASPATIFPCKSFRSPQISVHDLIARIYFTFT